MIECFLQRFISSSQQTLSLKILTFAPLKKLVAISLLFVFLSANTELHQLLKLPMLIHHFLEHHDHEPDETFAGFLNEHYSDTQNHCDTDHHDNLPFKTNDCATMHNNVAFNHSHNFSISQPTIISEKLLVAHNVIVFSSVALSNIWQPPKIS